MKFDHSLRRESLSTLANLLASNDNAIRRTGTHIRVSSYRSLRQFLANNLSLRSFLEYLRENGFKAFLRKHHLVIPTPRQLIIESYHMILDDIETKQEKIKNAIENVKESLSRAYTSNITLKSMIGGLVKSEKQLRDVLTLSKNAS
jgi:hypothetical protein